MGILKCSLHPFSVGQMWPRLSSCSSSGRGAGKVLREKSWLRRREGDRRGSRHSRHRKWTWDTKTKTPKLTPRISPNFLCLTAVWINILNVWTCKETNLQRQIRKTSLTKCFKDNLLSKSPEVCSFFRLNPTASHIVVKCSNSDVLLCTFIHFCAFSTLPKRKNLGSSHTHFPRSNNIFPWFLCSQRTKRRTITTFCWSP